MRETTFENAKVGDRVWDFRFGFGIIEKINPVELCYPIHVNFTNKHYQCYTIKGFINESDKSPALFWDEIKFEIPERPKRKVKKKVYIGINKINEICNHVTTNAYYDIKFVPILDKHLCIITAEIEVEE